MNKNITTLDINLPILNETYWEGQNLYNKFSEVGGISLGRESVYNIPRINETIHNIIMLDESAHYIDEIVNGVKKILNHLAERYPLASEMKNLTIDTDYSLKVQDRKMTIVYNDDITENDIIYPIFVCFKQFEGEYKKKQAMVFQKHTPIYSQMENGKDCIKIYINNDWLSNGYTASSDNNQILYYLISHELNHIFKQYRISDDDLTLRPKESLQLTKIKFLISDEQKALLNRCLYHFSRTEHSGHIQGMIGAFNSVLDNKQSLMNYSSSVLNLSMRLYHTQTITGDLLILGALSNWKVLVASGLYNFFHTLEDLTLDKVNVLILAHYLYANGLLKYSHINNTKISLYRFKTLISEKFIEGFLCGMEFPDKHEIGIITESIWRVFIKYEKDFCVALADCLKKHDLLMTKDGTYEYEPIMRNDNFRICIDELMKQKELIDKKFFDRQNVINKIDESIFVLSD